MEQKRGESADEKRARLDRKNQLARRRLMEKEDEKKSNKACYHEKIREQRLNNESRLLK